MAFSNALFLLLAPLALAASIQQRNITAPAGVLQLSLFQVPPTNTTDGPALTGRQVSTEADNFRYPHSTHGALGTFIEVGTPPQRVIVEPDTASTLLWVPSLQAGHQREGYESTFFDAHGSSSIQEFGRNISYKYGGGEKVEAEGYWDDVSIEGQSVGRMIVGVVDINGPNTHIQRHVGVLPLRPSRKDDDIFMPRKLFNQNMIKSTAFSLGVRQHGRGSLTFGGYDASKFSGRLEKLDMVPGKKHAAFFIQSISFNRGNGQDTVIVDSNSNGGNPVDLGLDSGSVAFYLPPSILQDFTANTGATVNQDFVEFSCNIVDSGAAIDFHITGNTVVSVPLSDFVSSRKDYGRTCTLDMTFRKPPANLIWVGRHFFRRAYVVHDFDSRAIHVARGADCGSTVVAIDGTMPDDVTGNCAHQEPEWDQQPPVAPGSFQTAPVPPYNPWYDTFGY